MDATERFNRVVAFVCQADVWRRIRHSPDNPKGWRNRQHAVVWYLANFDTAPQGQSSFLELDSLCSEDAGL